MGRREEMEEKKPGRRRERAGGRGTRGGVAHLGEVEDERHVAVDTLLLELLGRHNALPRGRKLQV